MVGRKDEVETGKRDKGGVEERNEREEARLVRRAGDEGTTPEIPRHSEEEKEKRKASNRGRTASGATEQRKSKKG